MTVATICLIFTFISYNYLVFILIDTLLESPRLNKLYRIPVVLLNTFLAAFFTVFEGSTSFMVYILIAIVMFIEFLIFYKDKASRALFCMLACIIHVMSIRSICVALFSIGLNVSIFEMVNDTFLLTLSMAVTFFFLDLAILCVIKFIPAKGIRIINQHKEQLMFMVGWLAVFALYLLANSRVYTADYFHPNLVENQIFAPIAVMLGTYIVLFFSIRMGEIIGYKEKNEELQLTVDRERQYRTSIDKDVFKVIEANFSRDELISGFEDYGEELGDMVNNYTDMLGFMTKTVVHPEDKGEFIKYSSPLTIVEEYNKGNHEISFEYRRLMESGDYVWMQILMPLWLDEDTGDVMGFVQIKNIDEVKKQQLELVYKAERDLLTGLYNKTTTEKLIEEYLKESILVAHTGVLFVIDIDNFKMINDNLGHLYGDAVLSELSESLRGIFRDYDIVGRIGGDEFLVCAKGLNHKDMIIRRAQEICNAFLRTYGKEQGAGITVSASVGIAVFPKDGITFENLFKGADAALYTTKARGKNGYSFYDENQALPYVSTRTEIDNHGVVQKNFKDNRIEYAFRLLYGSEDTKNAIESTLEIIAKNFGFSRANIFKFNESGTHFTAVFEWCASGISSVSSNYVEIPLTSFEFVISSLEKSGGMFMAVPSDFPDHARESYTSINIKSIVHFSIKERDRLIGVIAFQNCVDNRLKLSETEFEELRTICQVLSVFMAKQLSNEREQRHHEAIEAVMDNMTSIAYVIDRETYEVFYENQNTVAITGHSSVGTKCHCSYRGRNTPCPDCPLNHISDEQPRCTLELYTEKFNIYTKTSAALINWSDNRKAMLISSVDISEYKNPDGIAN